ncbi:polysaccharide biosynthesis/export family protein [Synechococcus sp. CCY9202]|uniref:polysaccharide biosynthesis/export family protein n=1 Tax=Synechococcus sp. CCY9202 TaxID=174698 RepID=UPI002B2090C9|nr:polysaccharide biosynthesis/export family protein [Synechococcus sp. CCY9202]MEA5423094.1 polysaccharide biosynthesis/export family protein [Synechococcus sp. CCY9202]
MKTPSGRGWRPAGVLLALWLGGGTAAGSVAPALAAEPLQPDPLPASLQEDAYLLGPGDSLELKLFDAPELSGPLDVMSDGTVSLPLLGSARVAGLTLAQASTWLITLYKQQLQRPELQLRVVRPRPLRIAVVGEVERPGRYSMSTSETTQTEGGPAVTISGLPTVVDAIQKAGGITQNADLRMVELQRRLPGEPVTFKRARLDLLQLLLQGDQLQDPLLFDGDTIRIGRAAEPVPEIIELSAANLSPQQINVNVIGEVKSPGRLELPANTPLVQAVLAAGGLETWRGRKSAIDLVRINRNGTATRERFALDLSQGASNAKNPPLRDNDTVIVNRSSLAVASDAIGAVSTPLSGLVNVLTLFRLINDVNNN